MAKKTPTHPAEKNPVGRPTKYRPEYCQRVIEYFKKPAYSTVILANGSTQTVPCVFPTMARFAEELDVARDTLLEWVAVHPDFSVAYKRALTLQESILQEAALAGAYQGSFAIFTAKNVCGWRDEKNLNLANAPGETFQTESKVTLTGLADVIQKTKAKR